MDDNRGCGVGFFGGNQWIWILVIVVIILIFCPGIFGCFGGGFDCK